MRAALVQLNVSDDVAQNLAATLAHVRQAQAGGAGFVLTPECTNGLWSNRAAQKAVLRDEGAVLPVSSVLENYRGVSGVALSVPSVVDASGVARVIDVPFSADEEKLFGISAAALRASLDSLGLS